MNETVLNTIGTVITAIIMAAVVLLIAAMVFLSPHTGEYICEGRHCWRDGPTHLELLIEDRE